MYDSFYELLKDNPELVGLLFSVSSLSNLITLLLWSIADLCEKHFINKNIKEVDK